MDQPRSWFERLCEAVAAVALAIATGEVGIQWSHLPASIPTHFNAAGAPDGSGGKSMLLILLGTTILTASVLTIAEDHQQLINIPMKLDRDAPEVRQVLRSMVSAMKAVITVSFLWISDRTIRIADGSASGLGWAFLPLFVGAIAGTIIFHIVRLLRLRQ